MNRFARDGAVFVPMAVPLSWRYGLLLKINVLFARI